MIGGQRIQVGLPYAGKTAEITIEADTYQITVEPGITITATRTTSRDIRRHKASTTRTPAGPAGATRTPDRRIPAGRIRDDAVMDQGQRRDVLRQAEDELRRAVSEHGWRSPQADAARQQQRALERSTAAEMGLPYAEPADLGVPWDAGAPMPVLISGLRTFVAFYLRIDDPLPFDGTNPSAWDPRPEIGVVEFKRVASVKKGSPNDEVLHGHPLWGSGLEFYQAHEVRNSPWIKELTDVNRVHGGFDESRWNRARHFVLTFHDETVECVAQEAVARTEPPAATMPQVVISLSNQAVG